MRIASFKLKNYKSFLNSEVLEFSSGFNVIVGQNNAGKTALLEALGLAFPSKPHKSLLSSPHPTTPLNPVSSAEVELVANGHEIREILFTSNGFFLPIPSGRHSESGPYFEGLLNQLFDMNEVRFHLKVENGELKPLKFPAHELYEVEIIDKTTARSAAFQLAPDRSGFVFKGVQTTNLVQELGITIAEIMRQRIYSFRAERMNIGSCSVGFQDILRPDAQNLAEVLSVLQGRNPSRFDRYSSLVRRIFPSVFSVSIRPQHGSHGVVEILIWTEDPNIERDDLAMPLSESGTGISQVLAILYVAINSPVSRVIIIDEPNSFLHPGAARKLIEILSKEFPQHQYIVSTHSPEIIKAANPSKLMLIRWEKPESKVSQLDANELTEARRCLLEVGVQLSDVFAADQILWVEGPTEEECFPLIFRDLLKKPILGFSILGVRNTGDFEGRYASAILDIYLKLSKSNALLPKAIAFVFDREDRTETEIQEMTRRLGTMLHFLPRRTYENYLIDPDALEAVLNSLETFQPSPISRGTIADWLSKNGGYKKYLKTPQEKVNIEDKSWLENVHGSKLLTDMLQELSEGKEYYRKTFHSVRLTEWLIGNKPNSLKELGEFLRMLASPDL